MALGFYPGKEKFIKKKIGQHMYLALNSPPIGHKEKISNVGEGAWLQKPVPEGSFKETEDTAKGDLSTLRDSAWGERFRGVWQVGGFEGHCERGKTRSMEVSITGHCFKEYSGGILVNLGSRGVTNINSLGIIKRKSKRSSLLVRSRDVPCSFYIFRKDLGGGSLIKKRWDRKEIIKNNNGRGGRDISREWELLGDDKPGKDTTQPANRAGAYRKKRDGFLDLK